jgi:hypothetical protein
MSDISVYTLKPFPWSRDGIKEESANRGDTLDLPAKLFHGLNKEGYVRRANIGDGHFSLRNVEPRTVEVASDGISISAPTTVVAEETHESTSQAVAAAAEVADTVSRRAPQPPVRTSDLTDAEEQAVADGTWRNLKFFAKRSLAAKVSTLPIKDGAAADAAIEAYIASKTD